MHSSEIHFRPPAPTPQPQPLGPIALLKTLRVNALECWTKAHFEEPIVYGGFPFASVAVVSEPSAVRQILVEDHASYRKSTLERRVLSARLRNGLVAVDGEQWQRLRRILAPLFGRKTTIAFASQMADAVEPVTARWRTLPEGSTVVMKTEMLRLALEGLVRCIFADGIGEPNLVGEATTEFYSTCGTLDPFDLLGFPEFAPRLTRLRERPILRAFDEGLYRAIAEKRRRLTDGSERPRDILDAMVTAKDPETGQGMSDREVKDNVMTFIFGGQETTSSALTWAFYLLSQSDEWRERVLAEACRLDSMTWPEALDALCDTRAVVEEALRLYPPIIAITRTALRRTEICGRTINRGTLVVVPPYVIHRHRLLWRDPDVFDPSRFLPGSSDKIERYTFLPFGVGPRMCVGASFAVHETTLALAILTRQFLIDVAPGEIVWPVQKNFTMRPRGGLRMTVAQR